MSKEQQKKHIIDMMEKDQELGLYDIFNDEKRQGVKDLIDAHKQETLEEAVNNFKKTDVYINEIKQEYERVYSEEDLFKILLDFVAFPHEHMEPRGSIIERYLKELKNK